MWDVVEEWKNRFMASWLPHADSQYREFWWDLGEDEKMAHRE
jgi:hypothetical protein